MKKDFDAVEWSRQTKRQISELLDGATPEEIIAYFNEGKLSEQMKEKQSQKHGETESR